MNVRQEEKKLLASRLQTESFVCEFSFLSVDENGEEIADVVVVRHGGVAENIARDNS